MSGTLTSIKRNMMALALSQSIMQSMFCAIGWQASIEGCTHAQAPAAAQGTVGNIASTKPSRFWYADGLPITLDRWSPNPPTVVEATIVQWNSQTVVLRLSSDNELHRYEAERVTAIDVGWETDSAAKTHQQFINGEHVKAVTSAVEEINAGKLPYWQAQILLAEMVESAKSLNRLEFAMSMYKRLVDTDAPTFLLASIPLCWTNRPVDNATEKLGAEWLKAEAEEIRLVGASWLLTGGERARAIDQLKKLQSSKKPMVASLADAQLWRTLPPAETLSRMHEWQTIRDKMHFAVQIGPTELIAEKLLQSDQPVLAVAEWMRIVSLHGDHQASAARALKLAQDAMRSMGRTDEADRMQVAFGSSRRID